MALIDLPLPALCLCAVVFYLLCFASLFCVVLAFRLPSAKTVFVCGDLNLEYDNAILDPLKEYMHHAASTALTSDGVKAITYRPLTDILKDIDQDFLRETISGECFSQLFYPSCKDEAIAALLKQL